MQREHADRPFTDLSFTDQIEQLTQWVMTQPGWRSASTSWIHELAEEAVSLEVGLHVLRGCAVELARIARDRDHVLPTDADWRRCKDSRTPREVRLVLAYVHGHRLRLDLRFRQLAAVVRRATEVPGDRLTDDALLCALEAFAALGLQRSRVDPILRRLVGLAHYDQWCREVQLHGFGIADHLPDQPDRIIKLSDEMVENGEGDPDVHYWRAYAQRRLGQFEKAKESIDRALATMPANQRESQAAYQREWEVIRTARELSELAARFRSGLHDESQRLHYEQERWFREHREQQETRIREHRGELDKLSTELRSEIELHSSAARQLVPDSARGVVELLTRFAVLVTLAVITGVLAMRADQAWHALVWIAVLLLAGAVVLGGMGPSAVLSRLSRRGAPRE